MPRDERKDREERLAAALRENLKRRKAQRRERADGSGETPVAAPAAEGGGDGDD